MFTVTDEWFKKHTRGEKGTPTDDQVKLFGLSYPLAIGWKNQIVGREITDELKARFELLCDARKNELMADSKRHAEMAERVYYTCPDGKGSWTGRWLEPHEVGTFPGPKS